MRFFTLLILSSSFLLLFSCDPTWVPQPSGPDCGYDLPLLKLSDGKCEPYFLDFENLNQGEAQSKPELPSKCDIVDSFRRKFQIEKPARSNSLSLHLYNGTRGRAQIQLFGTSNCGEAPVALTNCVDMSAAVSTLRLDDFSNYNQLYALVTYQDKNGDRLRAERGDFISVAAYGVEQKTEEVKYNGIDKENEIVSIHKSCDGESFQRILLVSCDPGEDYDAWAVELGLQKSEGYKGKGGSLQAYAFPPPTNTKKAEGSVKRKILDANDTGLEAVEDRIIFAEEIPDLQQDDRKQPQEALDCRKFKAGRPSSSQRSSNIVIANIDSGIDLAGPHNTWWNRHRNKSFSGPYSPQGYGYDFFNGDTQPEDQMGHGTATGGTLVGAYRGAHPLTVVHYKIFGPAGESTYFGALVALHVAIDNRVDIINASWGKVDNEVPDEMRCILKRAQEMGIQLFTSAGNDQRDINLPGMSAGPHFPQWPATFSTEFPMVTTVTSFEYTGGVVDPNPSLESQFANFADPTVNVAAYMTAESLRYGSASRYYPYGTSISSPLAAVGYANVLAAGGKYSDFQQNWKQSANLNGMVAKQKYIYPCD